jgi:putative transposase
MGNAICISLRAVVTGAARYWGTARKRDVFLKILDGVRTRYQFLLVGYVVMPEHIHLLISEPKVGNPSTVLSIWRKKCV